MMRVVRVRPRLLRLVLSTPLVLGAYPRDYTMAIPLRFCFFGGY